jgi:hypothetical protein
MYECNVRTRFPLAGWGSGEWGRGEKNAKRCHSLTGQRINCKLKTKIANTILLLCYFDKMCLSPSGVLWQASAFLYSGAEPIKLSPSWQPALSRLHYILQSTPLWKKEVGHSNTRGTVILCSFPAEILLHIVYISNILYGLEVIDSRCLQYREASLALFIITSNEHILIR